MIVEDEGVFVFREVTRSVRPLRVQISHDGQEAARIDCNPGHG